MGNWGGLPSGGQHNTDWSQGSKNRFCPEAPNNGVAVVDTTDPANPVLVSRLEIPVETSAEDVVVYTAPFGPSAGHDIAAAGIQVCGDRQDPSLARGLKFMGRHRPGEPRRARLVRQRLLRQGRPRVRGGGPARPGQDVRLRHGSLERAARARRSYRLPGPAWARTVPPGRHHRSHQPLRGLELGLHPRRRPDGESLGLRPGGARAGARSRALRRRQDRLHLILGQRVRGAGRQHPRQSLFRGRTSYPANADGDGHSSNYDDARKLLFTADEDFCPNSGPEVEKGWGYLRVFDYSDLSNPVQIGEFRTQNSLGAQFAAGSFTIHNPLLVGTTVYASWYSDGVRVIDVSDPKRPVEVGFFVPPAGQNPVKPSSRVVENNTTEVWGVAFDEDRDLIFASDINTGLWILRRTP